MKTGDEHKTDIPERFFSDAEGKPFEHCQVCGKFLLDPGTSYVVEKAVKSIPGHEFYSTVFEYAICLNCHSKFQQGMSAESVQNLQRYYAQVVAERGRRSLIIDREDFNLDSWLSHCFFTGESVEKMEEYQVVAQFNGPSLVMSMPPMLISGSAIEEMSHLLSDKTIDEMNGFREQYLGPDPQLEEFIFGKKLILI